MPVGSFATMHLMENLQQQVDEVAVLRSICGEDCKLLGPVERTVADIATIPSHGSSDCSSEANAYAAAANESQPDLAALCNGEPMRLRLNIYVQLPDDGITIQECSLPGRSPNTADADDKGIVVQHLPPLCLHLTLPGGYPSEAPPLFWLTASWLSAADIDALVAALSAQWDQQGPGMPICFSWVDWLQTSCLSEVGLSNSLDVTRLVTMSSSQHTTAKDSSSSSQQTTATAARPDQQQHTHEGHNDDSSDSAASSTTCLGTHRRPVRCDEDTRQEYEEGSRVGRCMQDEDRGSAERKDHIMMQLIQYDAARRFMLFQQGNHLCPVCYEDKPGRQCMRLQGCGHVFCAGCVATHASMHVAEGSVDSLQCLDGGCQTVLTAQDLQRVLTKQEVLRLEALRLQKALDCMADVVYCPRCQSPCLEDSDGSHCSQCTKCYFVFCTLCNATYHPGRRCMTPEEVLEVQRLRAISSNLGGGAEMRAKLQHMEEDLKSTMAIEKSAKLCPICSVPTHKNGGCNKMRCIRCTTAWCWTCGKAVGGYDHFRPGGCVLFNEADLLRWNAYIARAGANFDWEHDWAAEAEADEMPERDPGAPRDARRCPVCRSLTERIQNNNHILCGSCGTPFCGCCRSVLRVEGARHFTTSKSGIQAGRCKQHTKPEPA